MRIGAALASILFIPFFLGILYYLVTRWGWWKLYRMGPRRPLVRTWHGWVESEVEKSRNRVHKSRPPPRLVPRTTMADYSYVFWDPTGERERRFQQERDESLLRYAPRWLRSSAFGSAAPSSEADGNLEAEQASELRRSDHSSATDGFRNLALMGRRWKPDWRGARRYTDLEAARPYDGTQESYHTCFSVPEQDPDVDGVSTIRARRPMRRATAEWNSHSEGVQRATNIQLFAPTAAENLVRLFETPNDSHAEDYSFTNRHPSRRIQTWTCGPTKPRSRSVSVSLVDNDDGSVEEASDDDSKPWMPRKRGRITGSTSSGSAALRTRRDQETSYSAESMSMIEVPFDAVHVGDRNDGPPADDDAPVGEDVDETSDAETFSSLPIPRSTGSVPGDRGLRDVGSPGQGKVEFKVDLWYRIMPRSRSCSDL